MFKFLRKLFQIFKLLKQWMEWWWLHRTEMSSELSVSVWDRWEVRGSQDWTLHQFIQALHTNYGVKVTNLHGLPCFWVLSSSTGSGSKCYSYNTLVKIGQMWGEGLAGLDTLTVHTSSERDQDINRVLRDRLIELFSFLWHPQSQILLFSIRYVKFLHRIGIRKWFLYCHWQRGVIVTAEITNFVSM
jgi:hypothetical protein